MNRIRIAIATTAVLAGALPGVAGLAAAAPPLASAQATPTSPVRGHATTVVVARRHVRGWATGAGASQAQCAALGEHIDAILAQAYVVGGLGSALGDGDAMMQAIALENLADQLQDVGMSAGCSFVYS